MSQPKDRRPRTPGSGWYTALTVGLIGGVVLVVAGAGVVSFSVVRNLAEKLDFPAWSAWMFTPLVEVFLLLGGCETVLRIWGHLRAGKPGLPSSKELADPKRLVVGALITTCLLNAIGHLPAEWLTLPAVKLPLGAAMSIIIPLASWAAIDLLLGRLQQIGNPAGQVVTEADRDELLAGVSGQITTLAEELRARMDAALDAQRAQLEERLESTAAGATVVLERVDALSRQLDATTARQLDAPAVDARVDASTKASTRREIAALRDGLEAAVRETVASQVSTVRVHLDRQVASTSERVDARVDTAVREQLRQALPELSREIAGSLREELEAHAEQAVSTSVQQHSTHRELQGRDNKSDRGAPRAAIVATYLANPNPTPPWSKWTLAEAAGYPRSSTVAQDVLTKAKSGELDARPDASTPSVQEAAS